MGAGCWAPWRRGGRIGARACRGAVCTPWRRWAWCCGWGRWRCAARSCCRSAPWWRPRGSTAAVSARRYRLAALGAGGELREFELARHSLRTALGRERREARRRERAQGHRTRIAGQGELVRERGWPVGRAVCADDRRPGRGAGPEPGGQAPADRRRDGLGQDGQRAPLAARAHPGRRGRGPGHRPEGRRRPRARPARGGAVGRAAVGGLRSARPARRIGGIRCGRRTPARW